MIDFDELAKNYTEILDDLLEQSEDFEVNSVNELVEKLNDYGKEIYTNNKSLATKELIEYNQKQMDLIMSVKRKI